MNVLILGFENEQEIDNVMEKLIAESGCYLFNVIVGGVRESAEVGPSEKWASYKGAPRYYVYRNNGEELIRELGRVADFLVIKVGKRTPQWQKNLMMKMKSEGKHGYTIYES